MAMAMSAARSRAGNGSSSLRTARLVFIGLFHAFAPIVTALPMPFGGGMAEAFKKDADEDLPKSPDNPQLWLFLGIAVALVLAGGVFAGLTIA
jgi:metal transporter CNNM